MGKQKNALAGHKIIEVNGVRYAGLLNIEEELGTEEDGIEIPFAGKTRQIANGMEKIEPINLKFLILRDGETDRLLLEWKQKGDTRDVVIWETDRSGRLENAYKRWLLSDCELGKYKSPGHDEGSIEKMETMVRLFPWDIEPEIL